MNNKGLSYLLEESLGKQWHFYISDKQLLYTCKTGDAWSTPEVLDSQSPKFFCCTIDKNDTIYILVYTSAKQLHYYEWDGAAWLHKKLYNVASRFENISFINMTATSQNVHLFYYIENSLRRTQEALVHYYLKNGEWQKGEFFYFYSDHNIKPYIINNTPQGNLYFLYTKKLQNQTYCYLSYLDTKTMVWTKPDLLFKKTVSCSEFNSYIDPSEHIHLVWKESIGSITTLYYKKISHSVMGEKQTDNEVIIAKVNGAVENLLLHGSKVFYCSWMQDGKGMLSRSEQSDKAWSDPDEIHFNDVKPYYHIKNGLDGRSRTNLVIGDGYPEYKWSIEKLPVRGAEIETIETTDTLETVDTTENKEISGTTEKTRINESMKKVETKDKPKEQAAMAGNSILSYKNKQAEEDELIEKQKELSEKIDEIYGAIYQIQDHIQKRDRTFYQMDALLKKLSFEVEQLRMSRGKDYRVRSINYEIPDTDLEAREYNEEPSADPISPGNGSKSPDDGDRKEITLGNTTIIINSDEVND